MKEEDLLRRRASSGGGGWMRQSENTGCKGLKFTYTYMRLSKIETSKESIMEKRT